MTWSEDERQPPADSGHSRETYQEQEYRDTPPDDISCPVCDRLVPPPAPETCPHCQAPIHTIFALLKTVELSLREAMRDIGIGRLDDAERRLEFVSATSKSHRLRVEVIRAIIERVRGNPQAALERLKAVKDRIEEVDETLIDLLEEAERHALEDQEALAACCEHYNFGLFQAGKGHYEESRKSLRRALDLVPHHAPSHALIGKIQVALQDYDDARYHLGRALASDPTNVSASRMLARLGRRDRLNPLEYLRDLFVTNRALAGPVLVIVILAVIAIAALLSR